jgi:hypothetical protein
MLLNELNKVLISTFHTERAVVSVCLNVHYVSDVSALAAQYSVLTYIASACTRLGAVYIQPYSTVNCSG